jgi:hypothetical protein
MMPLPGSFFTRGKDRSHPLASLCKDNFWTNRRAPEDRERLVMKCRKIGPVKLLILAAQNEFYLTRPF